MQERVRSSSTSGARPNFRLRSSSAPRPHDDPELPAKPEAAKTFEIDVEPTVAGRFARRLAEARALRTRVEGARCHHASLELAFDIFESDSSIGGGLLA